MCCPNANTFRRGRRAACNSAVEIHWCVMVSYSISIWTVVASFASGCAFLLRSFFLMVFESKQYHSLNKTVQVNQPTMYMYSGASLIRTPLVQNKVSRLVSELS